MGWDIVLSDSDASDDRQPRSKSRSRSPHSAAEPLSAETDEHHSWWTSPFCAIVRSLKKECGEQRRPLVLQAFGGLRVEVPILEAAVVT